MDVMTLIGMLCTCQRKPLGLDFVLTAGCLVHDRCVCHELGSFALDPVAGPVTRQAEGTPSDCLWCESYVALLKGIGSLDELTRERLKRAYLDAKG
jgi:hypothetical protein